MLKELQKHYFEKMKNTESQTTEFKSSWRDEYRKIICAFRKREHSSYPRNPLIANAFYLAGFIERWGSGTRRIVDLCKGQGLPEPEYKEEQGGFSVYFYRDIYTEENLRKMGLNERQIKAVMFTKQHGRITNTEYQRICNVKKRQATNDLHELEKKKILEKIGATGKGTYYILGHQRGKRGIKGAIKGQKRQKTHQKNGEG